MAKFSILFFLGLIVLSAQLWPKVDSYNILFALSFTSRSHKNVMDPIMVKLLEKGHQITVLGPFSKDENVKGVATITLQSLKEEFERSAGGLFFEMNKMSVLERFRQMVYMTVDVCRQTYEDPDFQTFIKKKDHKFDLVIVDGVFNEYMLPMAHHLGVPSFYISPGGLFPAANWNLNIPSNPVAYPPHGLPFKGQLTFKQRFIAGAIVLVTKYMRDYMTLPLFEEIVRKTLPNTPPLLELERNVSFVITNTFPTTTGVHPTMPFMAEIGGLNCLPAKKLNEELETLVKQSGDKGFIYFSLGSVTKGSALPEAVRLKFIEVFKRLPETVLWKFEKPMEDAPPNVKIQKWMPQQDLLGDPKCKLFITHGGLLSTQEAMYHGVPLLVLPLSADQFGNAAQVIYQGYGDKLSYDEFTVEEGVAMMRKLIDDPKYRKTSQDLSVYLKDRPIPPAEVGAYWIEYVIRHKGAPHLKPKLGDLNFFQYFLLDVIGAILAVVGVVLGIVGFILCRLCRFIKCKFCSKTKKENPKNAKNKKKNQ